MTAPDFLATSDRDGFAPSVVPARRRGSGGRGGAGAGGSRALRVLAVKRAALTDAEVEALSAKRDMAFVAGLAGVTVSARQAASLLGPDPTADELRQVLLHTDVSMESGRGLAQLFEGRPPWAAKVAASVPTLGQRVPLYAPAYASMFQRVAERDNFYSRRFVLSRELAADRTGQAPLALASVQVLELLLAFPSAQRRDVLAQLWSRWRDDGHRALVESAFGPETWPEVEPLVLEPAPPTAAVSLTSPVHAEQVRAVLGSLTTEGLVHPVDVLRVVGGRPLDAFEVRDLLLLVFDRKERFQLLEGLLLRWTGEGAPALFLELLSEDDVPVAKTLVSSRPHVERAQLCTPAFLELQERLVEDVKRHSGLAAPPRVPDLTLSSVQLRALLCLYKEYDRLHVLRTLLLHWRPDGEDETVLAPIHHRERQFPAWEALNVARTVDRGSLDEPGFQAFLAEARGLDRNELSSLLKRPESPGLFGRVFGQKPKPRPASFSSLQVRYLLGWQRGEDWARLFLERLSDQRRADGGEELVLGVFQTKRAEAQYSLRSGAAR